MSNATTIEAWNGVLFDRFVAFREIVTTGLGAHGEAALRVHPPRAGARVVDLGCGFGDTTRRLARVAGEAVGVDAAPRFIALARREATERNVRFLVADVQSEPLDGRFDYAFSRFGTMFFANPVAALRNVRRALVPGGRLCMVVWRRKPDNEWLHRAERVVSGLVARPESSDEPTCGPGPFSMADADTTTDVLVRAGFERISLHRNDDEIVIGATLEQAVAFVMALGPAGELIRLAGDDGRRPAVAAALRASLAELQRPGELESRAPASTWIVGASAPGGER